MHIWKIFTCLWFRKDSLVSPSQLFLSCHPILLPNKWLLTFKPHSFPILANHSYCSISCNCFMPNYPFTCCQIITCMLLPHMWCTLSSLSSHSLVFVPRETNLRLHRFNKNQYPYQELNLKSTWHCILFFFTCNSNDFFYKHASFKI